MLDIGVMYRCDKKPENLREFAQTVETAGFDELWLVEDCFFAGGIASVAAALAATQRIRVGLGIVPAVSRNPAFTAMEFAALARLHPRRFLPGIGHGVGAWMKQIGAFPGSQLAALEEVTLAVRELLCGECVSMQGRHVHLDEVALEFPPEHPPLVQLGVRGPKSLALSGRVADGTILAEGAAPAYVKWARQQIAIGQAQGGRRDHHRLTVYVWASLGDDRNAARAVIRPIVARALPRLKSQLAPAGLHGEVSDLLGKVGQVNLAQTMPDRWLDALTVSGVIQDCLESIQRFIEVGADALVFVLPSEDERGQIRRLVQELLPRIRK